MKTILLLEDNDERIAAFQKTVAALGDGFELKVWRDAPSMIAKCETFFPTAALISLDHDLNPMPGATGDPGTGVDVARFLGDFMPVCPVLIHSSNTDRVYSMHNELRFAGWMVDRVGPIGADWIETSWLRNAKRLLAECSNTWKANLPADHAVRIERMKLSLDGLGLGDALGEMLCYQAHIAPRRLAENNLPTGPWFHTDDTEMAISIVAVLKSHGFIEQDALAKRFARRFERDPERGYGKMTRIQMREIMAGAKWRETAANAFGGQGSMGNGSAMRIAPLGAYFADNLERCAKEAEASSLVTHTHPEGVAGAIAIAVAAATAWELRNDTGGNRVQRLFDAALRHAPESKVRRGIRLASTTPPEIPLADVARALGNGSLVTAPDTVPFCVWMAAHHLDHFVEALGKTISIGGDCDTNAAVVGGILALSAGRESIPVEWLKAREPVIL
ncbi:MAG TPA: ADP-ribosylglycohydrolase family protein [Candidatus Eisenbacteria bacterium]|nr:ADP-ribosylglycohydrolase family protein [Candidatus Eisenbacteria bacterium]